MNNNSWFKKQKPLLGLLGLSVGGGGVASDPPMEGSGGYVNEYASPGSPTGYYRTHVFVSPGRFSVTTSPGEVGSNEFDVITIGGGGGGGSNNGGGGGAGGWVEKTGMSAAVGVYAVKIGVGGAGRFQSATQAPYSTGMRGGDTTFETPTITQTGGGGGGGSRYASSPGVNDLYIPVIGNIQTGNPRIGSGGGGGYGPSPGWSESALAGATGDAAPAPMGTGRGNAGGAGGAYNIEGGGGGASNAGTAGANGNQNTPGYIYGAGGNGYFNNWVFGTNKYYAGGGGASSNMNGTGMSGTPNDARAGNGGYGGGGGGGNGGPGRPGPALANQGAGGVSGGWGVDGEPGLDTSVPGSLSYYNNNNFMPDPNGNPGYANRGGTAAFMTGSGGGGGGGGCAVPTYDSRWGKQVSGGNGAPGLCLVRYAVAAPGATGTATGGLISETPTHRIHTFIGPGTLVTEPNFNSGSDQPTGEIVAIGGGGSGGAHFGGGGGAGRYYTGAFTVRKASTYTIVVGQGGEGGYNGPKIPGTEGTQTTITHPTVGTQVYCGGGGGGGTRDGGPTIDKGWPGQGPTSSRGSGGGAGAANPAGTSYAGDGGSLPGTNAGGDYEGLYAAGGGGASSVGTNGSNPTDKAGPGGTGIQIPSTFRDSTTCVFGASGPGSTLPNGSSWGWVAGGGGGAGGYPSSSLPTAMPKFGTGGGAPQTVPSDERTPHQPHAYAGGGGGSGWGGVPSYDPTANVNAANPFYGRGRAQGGLCGTGGGGGGFGPEGFIAGQGSGPGAPGILIIAYPKTS